MKYYGNYTNTNNDSMAASITEDGYQYFLKAQAMGGGEYWPSLSSPIPRPVEE